jgi:hypothetical protein
MITWFGWTWDLGQGLFMEHCSFEFWILVGFESWWCDLGLPKRRRFGEENYDFWTHSFGKRVRGVVGTL